MFLDPTIRLDSLAATLSGSDLSSSGKNSAIGVDSCSRIGYNLELAAINSEMSEVHGCLTKIRTLQDSVSQAYWQIKAAATTINNRLAAFPPARPAGTVFPPDLYTQILRAGHTFRPTRPLDQMIEVVQADFIPQSMKTQISYSQFIPTTILENNFGRVSIGKNSSQLYSFFARVNKRAKTHLLDDTQEIYGNAIHVKSPLDKESWFPLHVPQPVQDLKDSVKALHNISITRFTIDRLEGGGFILSFADRNDSLAAKLAL